LSARRTTAAKARDAEATPPAPPFTLESAIDETETSRQLKIAVKTLRNWRGIGRGPPFFYFGRLVRYSPAENAKWAASCRAASTSDHRANEAA
jgi:hypothetical protein